MLAKSQSSFNLGDQLLTKKKYFDHSIHCFYYSTLQLMKHKLANLAKEPISYKEQLQKSQNSSSHQYLLETIILKFSSGKTANKFQDAFKALKKFRLLADYGEKPMKIDDCVESKELNIKANSYLRDIH